MSITRISQYTLLLLTACMLQAANIHIEVKNSSDGPVSIGSIREVPNTNRNFYNEEDEVVSNHVASKLQWVSDITIPPNRSYNIDIQYDYWASWLGYPNILIKKISDNTISGIILKPTVNKANEVEAYDYSFDNDQWLFFASHTVNISNGEVYHKIDIF